MKIPWRRKWQQYSCLGKFHGQRSLVVYSPQGRKESDMTEQLHFLLHCRWTLYQLSYQGSPEITLISFNLRNSWEVHLIWLQFHILEFFPSKKAMIITITITVHGVTKSQTQLSTHTYREHCLMNTHPIAEKSILTLSIWNTKSVLYLDYKRIYSVNLLNTTWE